MSGRTFVVIFVFWALLTIITPTLIHLSDSVKHKSSSHGDWRSDETRTRKMVGHLKKQYEYLRGPIAPSLQELSPAPAPAPAPAPDLGSETGRASRRPKMGAVPKPKRRNISALIK